MLKNRVTAQPLPTTVSLGTVSRSEWLQNRLVLAQSGRATHE